MKRTVIWILSAHCFALLCVSGQAHSAKCDPSSREAQLFGCRQENLQKADRELNETYRALLGTFSGESKAGLIRSQRNWLRERNASCLVTPAESAASDWLEQISQQPAKAKCVEVYTVVRTVELQALTKRQPAKPSVGRKAEGERSTRPGVSYPPVNSTWGEEFNPSGNAPLNQFKAFYFNSQRPKEVIASEVVPDIGINYAWDSFHGIHSKDFGAYWVGRMRFDADSPRVINVSMSWSKARIVIDRQLVYEGGGNKRVPFVFAAGEHLIEVEFLNNWHTTEFMVEFAESRERLPSSELKRRFGDERFRGAKVISAAVYESSRLDLLTNVTLKQVDEPVILLLSSYSPVKWQVHNPHRVDIRAVAVGSYKPGSRLIGDIAQEVETIEFEGQLGSYSTEQRCSCLGSHFRCEGSNLNSTVVAVEKATGKQMLGFAGKYSASDLFLPAINVTRETLSEAQVEEDKVRQQRMACQRQNQPDFEGFMQGR